MDINVTVAAMRQLAADMHAWQAGDEDPDEPGEYYRIASKMVENFDAMDGWLVKGGFPPDAWQHARDGLGLQRRNLRLRNALLVAGVPENLVRSVELGGTEQEARSIVSTRVRTRDEQAAGRPFPTDPFVRAAELSRTVINLKDRVKALEDVLNRLSGPIERLLADMPAEASDDQNLREHTEGLDQR